GRAQLRRGEEAVGGEVQVAVAGGLPADGALGRPRAAQLGDTGLAVVLLESASDRLDLTPRALQRPPRPQPAARGGTGRPGRPRPGRRTGATGPPRPRWRGPAPGRAVRPAGPAAPRTRPRAAPATTAPAPSPGGWSGCTPGSRAARRPGAGPPGVGRASAG